MRIRVSSSLVAPIGIIFFHIKLANRESFQVSPKAIETDWFVSLQDLLSAQIVSPLGSLVRIVR